MRGIVLVLIASLLSILALIAVVMMRIGIVGRQVQRGRVEGARARLLAVSGVECALARLTRDASVPAVPTRANARDDWRCRDIPSVPLEGLENPSYAHGEPYVDGGAGDGRYAPPPGSPDAFNATTDDRNRDGTHTGFSGRLRGSHQEWGDTYALRVTSEEGKLYVNGGYLTDADVDPANGMEDRRDRDAGYNVMLRRVLNLLGAHADVDVPGLGDLVIDNRPVGGYRSLADLPPTITPAQRARLTAYLTCHAWVDRSVIRPNVSPAQVLTATRVLADFIVERGGAPILEPAGRAPVNINLASEPVLVALLTDLSGAFRMLGSLVDPMRQVSVTITAAQAATIAQKIVEVRGGNEDLNHNGYLDAGEDTDSDGYLDSPFVSWSQFGLFCDTLVRKGVLPLVAGGTANKIARTDAPTDLLQANFNPNSDLNKNNPDSILHHAVDKSDLLTYSTEFSLHPLAGIHTIESLGVLWDPFGIRVASSRVAESVQLYYPLRQTTQRDFVGGRANLTEYVTPMRPAGLSPTSRTFGASRGLGGAAGIGVSLMTYPEPYAALAPGGAGPAPFDGQVALATTEMSTEPNVMFHHRFTDSWTADGGAASLNPLPIQAEDGVLLDARLQTDVTRSTQDPTRPNTLVPDGANLQTGRSLMYASVGNVPPLHGVVSYWVKRGLDPYRDERCDVSISQVPIPGLPGWAQFWGIGVHMEPGNPPMYGMVVEAAQTNSDKPEWRRYVTHTNPYSPMESPFRHRWLLVTAGWNLEESTNLNDLAWFEQRGCNSDPPPASMEFYTTHSLGLFVPTSLPADGRRLVLGGGRADWDGHFGSCNHVMDEIAFYDYGSDTSAAKTLTSAMASVRYADGRYYKSNDGQFRSVDLATLFPSSIRLPCRVERVYWTEVLPRNLTVSGSPLPPDPPAIWDARLANARLQVELIHGPDAAPSVLYDSETFPALDYLAAARVNTTAVTAPFRYRVTFKPTPNWSAGDRMNLPVLETPFLDDVTLLLRPAGYPRSLSWEEG